jgi:hypothetical protein
LAALTGAGAAADEQSLLVTVAMISSVHVVTSADEHGVNSA